MRLKPLHHCCLPPSGSGKRTIHSRPPASTTNAATSPVFATVVAATPAPAGNRCRPSASHPRHCFHGLSVTQHVFHSRRLRPRTNRSRSCSRLDRTTTSVPHANSGSPSGSQSEGRSPSRHSLVHTRPSRATTYRCPSPGLVRNAASAGTPMPASRSRPDSSWSPRRPFPQHRAGRSRRVEPTALAATRPTACGPYERFEHYEWRWRINIDASLDPRRALAARQGHASVESQRRRWRRTQDGGDRSARRGVRRRGCRGSNSTSAAASCDATPRWKRCRLASDWGSSPSGATNRSSSSSNVASSAS